MAKTKVQGQRNNGFGIPLRRSRKLIAATKRMDKNIPPKSLNMA